MNRSADTAVRAGGRELPHSNASRSTRPLASPPGLGLRQSSGALPAGVNGQRVNLCLQSEHTSAEKRQRTAALQDARARNLTPVRFMAPTRVNILEVFPADEPPKVAKHRFRHLIIKLI